MADDPTADELRDGLGYICEHLERLRDRLARYGKSSLLDALMDAEAGGDSLDEHVGSIHRAVKARDGRGIYGATRSGEVEGLSVGRSANRVYLCPSDRCSRWSEETSPPQCELGRVPLRAETLTA